jgi:hypothetical protein
MRVHFLRNLFIVVRFLFEEWLVVMMEQCLALRAMLWLVSGRFVSRHLQGMGDKYSLIGVA